MVIAITSSKIFLRNYYKNKFQKYIRFNQCTLGINGYINNIKLFKQFQSYFKSHLVNLSQPLIVALYYPLSYEPNSLAIIKWLWQHNIIVVLPVVQPNSKLLTFINFTFNSQLIENKFGIKQPMDGEKLTPNIIIMPVIAFNNQGYRLGHGGGYYDYTLQYLQNSKVITAIGLAYSWQYCPSFKPDNWDIPLNGIVTEKNYTLFNN